MKRWLIALVALAVVAGGAWAWGSPHWTVWQLKKAAEARDTAAISAHVDYPAVRESLKVQLRGRFAQAGAKTPLDAFAATLAQRLTDPIIDATITPEGMQAVFATAAATPKAHRPGPANMRAEDMVLEREAFDRFILRSRDGKGGALVFRLRGASWMLTELRLPADEGPKLLPR